MADLVVALLRAKKGKLKAANEGFFAGHSHHRRWPRTSIFIEETRHSPMVVQKRDRNLLDRSKILMNPHMVIVV